MLAFVGKFDKQLVWIFANKHVRWLALSVWVLHSVLFLRQNIHHFNAAQQATDRIILWESQIIFPIKILVETFQLFYFLG